MPAVTTARKQKEPKEGRPFGSVTRFPGSVVFSREAGVTQGHLYRVLMGERQSKSLVAKYAAFLSKQGIAWPSSAKMKADGRPAK